jgi:hypothetical protein
MVRSFSSATALLVFLHALVVTTDVHGQATKLEIGPRPTPVIVAPPPPGMNLPPYYQKYLDADGIKILASAKVPDEALIDTRKWVTTMLGQNPTIRQAMARHGATVVILPENEPITSVPGMEDLPQKFPKQDWTKRRNGGGTLERPLTWTAAEHVLRLRGDKFPTENNTVHEFGHAVENIGIALASKPLHDRLGAAYDAAVARGLWKGTYAGTNRNEYFAEGSQSWFNCNRQNDKDHNQVDTRAELKQYDPELAAILTIVYGDVADQSMKRRGEQ